MGLKPDEFKALEDVGDVVEPSNPGLHDCVRQHRPVDHLGSKLQVDLGHGLKFINIDPGNAKRGSITVLFTSCLTGLESAV